MMNEEIKIPDFSIDAGHELALFIWNSDNKLIFLNEDTFCITKSEQCSTYVLPFTKCVSNKSPIMWLKRLKGRYLGTTIGERMSRLLIPKLPELISSRATHDSRPSKNRSPKTV